MEAERDFYRGILDNLHDGIYFLDEKRLITYWNRGAERITGYPATEILGRSCSENILVHSAEDGSLLCQQGCPVAATLIDGAFRESDVYLRHANGHRVPVSVRVSPILNPAGGIIGAVETFSENSEKIAALEIAKEFQQLALLDPLTQIGNRRFAEMELHRNLDEYQRSGVNFGILIADIDHFKQVNDRYGHDVGDAVLKMVAQTLAKNIRAFEFVGRWGGEEFIILTKNIQSNFMVKMADRLRRLIRNSWLAVDEHNVKVTASFGGTIFTLEDTLESAFTRADRNLYQSKNTGRNRVTISDQIYTYTHG